MWTNREDGTAITSPTIPNQSVAEVDNRMPVILGSGCVEPWLSEGNQDVESLLSCLVPHPSEEMEMSPVSLLVNKPGVDHIARSIPRLPG